MCLCAYVVKFEISNYYLSLLNYFNKKYKNMARLLYPYESSSFYLRTGRRHVRLCGRVNGTGKYAAMIQPVLDALAEKEKERMIATCLSEDAYDDVVLCDADLDNAVRTTFEKIKQYDREHTTAFIKLFFPANGFSKIVKMPFSKEAQEVKNIVIKLDGLEDGHELKSLSGYLLQKVEASFEAWDNYGKSLLRIKELRATEEISKLAVRQQYERNWLDARKEFGLAVANSLFPKMDKRAAKNDENNNLSPEK
jgi:hypothetical protein